MNNYLNKDVELTTEQLSVLKHPGNVVVTGEAGTGKTMCAIHLAAKLSKDNSVAVIISTKALRRYIEQTLVNLEVSNVDVFHTSIWSRYDNKSYDTIIIDEAQDLSFAEIQKALVQCSKVFIFGDAKQSIYDKSIYNNKATLNIESLPRKLDMDHVVLSSNIRLHRGVGNFVNDLIPFSYKDFRNSQFFIPKLIRASNPIEELTKIVLLIKDGYFKGSIGILLGTNDGILDLDSTRNLKKGILSVAKVLSELGLINVGYKYKTDDSNLNFEGELSVNVMTYHSSKGLEFDNVIMPFMNELIFDGKLLKKLFYIGCTRATQKLVLTYSNSFHRDYRIINSEHFDGDIVNDDFPEDLELQLMLLATKYEALFDLKNSATQKSHLKKDDDFINEIDNIYDESIKKSLTSIDEFINECEKYGYNRKSIIELLKAKYNIIR